MTNRQPMLALDSDGVFANFDKKASEIFGMPSREFEDLHGEEAFWTTLEKDLDFFGSMELIHDAMDLYNAVKHLDPIFLSGVPRGDWAAPQKVRWYQHYFPDNRLITCPSREKFMHMSAPGDILVDDYLKHRHIWEGAGGIFVHHTSAANSIEQLRELGVDVR